MQRLRVLAGAALLALAPLTAEAQERYAVGGADIAIYNLAGRVELVGTSAGQVTVDVVRGGRDGGELRVEVGRLDGRQALRVVYPSNRIVYRDGRFRGTSSLRVRDDGTWAEGGGRGRVVRISGSGSGLEAHADLRVGVPMGQRVELHLGVGRIVAENLDGRVRLRTGSGQIDGRQLAGDVAIHTGAGAVAVEGMSGTLTVRTGSGSVRVAGARGDSVSVRTGSGRVVVERMGTDRARIHTGSGSVQLRDSAARSLHVHTGSGSVSADLTGPTESLNIRTGSGGVQVAVGGRLDATVGIRTGSGRIDFGFPILVTSQGRRELRGVVGEGAGSIQISTGSGNVRLRAL